MTLNGVMAVTLRYFTEFGKPVFHPRTASICAWPNLCTSLLYFVVRVRCRRKESSRSLSHLLMSFFFLVKQKWLHCRKNKITRKGISSSSSSSSYSFILQRKTTTTTTIKEYTTEKAYTAVAIIVYMYINEIKDAFQIHSPGGSTRYVSRPFNWHRLSLD